MTLEELNITKEQWIAALHVIEHPWREGQLCEHHVTQTASRHSEGHCISCGCTFDKWDTCEHSIPMPAVTDELLMRMLDFIATQNCTWALEYTKCNPAYYMSVWDESGKCLAFEKATTKDAAIILATANLEVK